MNSYNSSNNVILLTRGTKGDLYPFIHIGRGLKELGHRVTLLSNYNYGKYATQEGFDFDSLALNDEDSIASMIELPEFYSNLPLLLKLYKEYIIPNLENEYNVIEKKVKVDNVVILAHSNYYLPALFAMEKLNIPVHICVLSPTFVYSLTLLEGVLKKLAIELNNVRAKIGLAPISDWKKWLSSYSKCFAFWPEWFSTEGKKILPDLDFIGFLSVDNFELQPLQDSVKKFVTTDKKKILITHGTSKPFNDNYFNIAIEVSRQLGCKLIISTPFRELVPEVLSENEIRVDFCPFDEILPSIDLIIHHGGIGTTRESAAQSIPQLIIGQGFDRQDNGRIVKSLGIGGYILPKILSKETLSASINGLLNNQEIQLMCGQYSQLLKNQKPKSTFYESIFSFSERQNESARAVIDFHHSRDNVAEQENLSFKVEQLDANQQQIARNLSPEKQALFLQILKKKSKQNENKIKLISNLEKKSGLALSATQGRIWRLAQHDPENTSYRIIKGYEIFGELDIDFLKLALAQTVRQHEMLCTSFVNTSNDVHQILNEDVSIDIDYNDLRNFSAAAQSKSLRKITAQDSQYHFDLSRAPLLKVRLVALADKKNVLIITGHLLVSDAHSLDVIFECLGKTYGKLKNGERINSERINNLTLSNMQYADYVRQQFFLFEQGTIETKKKYWQQHLRDMNSVLEFPLDKERPEKLSHSGDYISFNLGRELTNSIRNKAKLESVSVFVFLLCAYNILCLRFTGRTDIVLGCPISNRTKEEWRSLVGHFSNMLILRNTFKENMSIKETLAVIKKNTLDAFANQDIPFEELVDLVKVFSATNRSPIVQNTFGFQSDGINFSGWNEFSVNTYDCDTGIAKYDLEMLVRDTAEGFVSYLIYNKELFSKSTIERIKTAYVYILQGMLENIDASICSLQLCNNSGLENGAPVSIEEHQIDFYRSFISHSNEGFKNPALILDNCVLTYGQLNENVNKLANCLGKNQAGLVGLCVEGTIDAIIAVLALIKINQSFVLIDPDCMKEEREAIISFNGLKNIIIQPWLLDFLEWPNDVSYLAYSADQNVYPENSFIQSKEISTEQCVVYFQKINVSKNSVAQLSFSQIEIAQQVKHLLNFGGCGTANLGTISGAIHNPETLIEIAFWLSTGGTILVPNAGSKRNLAYWQRLFSDHSITHAFLSFDEMEAFQQLLNSHDLVIPESLNNFFIKDGPQNFHVINPSHWNGKEIIQLKSDSKSLYAFYTNLIDRKNNVWSPIDNYRYFIANEHLQECPINVAGFLYERIGSTWRNTGLNARYSSEKEYEFLNTREKIKGINVFPTNIENVLRNHSSVRYALVQKHSNLLRAYVVLIEPGNENMISILHQYLKIRLSDNEVPESIQIINHLPLLPNGVGIDWDALPEPRIEEKIIIAPKSEQEKIILEIWSEVLDVQVDKLSTDDNFFELGGHSLLATHLILRIQQRIKINLTLKTLFKNPTIAQLSSALELITPVKKNRIVI